MDGSILNIISENYFSERIDAALLHDSRYLEIMDHIARIDEKLEKSITDDAKQLVEKFESEYLSLNACYGQIAYRQGFRDCASLLAEMGILKQSGDYNG